MHIVKTGVLSSVTKILSKNQISVKRLIQNPFKSKKYASIIVISHKAKNINLINASFESVLPKLSKYDFNFIYFDGNHTKKATLNYFSWALEQVKENDVFIFDDIYWSKEMNEAWNNIVNHQKTTLTIDLFSIGIVFFNKNLSKENFKLIHKANFY